MHAAEQARTHEAHQRSAQAERDAATWARERMALGTEAATLRGRAAAAEYRASRAEARVGELENQLRNMEDRVRSATAQIDDLQNARARGDESLRQEVSKHAAALEEEKRRHLETRQLLERTGSVHSCEGEERKRKERGFCVSIYNDKNFATNYISLYKYIYMYTYVCFVCMFIQ